MSLQVCAQLSGRTDTHNKLSPGVIPFDTPERRQVALTTQEKRLAEIVLRELDWPTFVTLSP